MIFRFISISLIAFVSNLSLAAAGPQKPKDPSEMVTVPAGQFQYQNKSMFYLDAFMIDKYEITNEFYCRFLNSTDPCDAHFDEHMQINRILIGGIAGTLRKYQYTVKAGKERFPICFVTVGDAEAFAAWRSKTYDGTYSLPTEQQWEKAAGWDPVQKKLFKYGCHCDVIDKTLCNFDNTKGPVAVGTYNGTNGTKDAKSYYGCYDMCGNVWEWTSTPYDRYTRVVRGGSFWSDEAEFCSTTARGSSNPFARADDIGFRLVLKSEPNIAEK